MNVTVQRLALLGQPLALRLELLQFLRVILDSLVEVTTYRLELFLQLRNIPSFVLQ